MRAYWYDNEPGDQRLPHDSGRPATPSDLAALGILHFTPSTPADVDAIAAERAYKHRDEITVSREALGPAYEPKIRAFFAEHLHEDEEIRYLVDGGGFFDVRGADDAWIRIALEQGDLIVMPAGIYHRFTTDQRDYTKALRLFKDEPSWTPLNRGPETDDNVFRKSYLHMRDSLPATS